MFIEGSVGRRMLGGIAFVIVASGLVVLSIPREARRESGAPIPSPSAAIEPAAPVRDADPSPAPPARRPDTSPPRPAPARVPTADDPAQPERRRLRSIHVRVDFVDALTGNAVEGVRWKEKAASAGNSWRESGDVAEMWPPFGEITVEPPAGWVCLGPEPVGGLPPRRARAGVLTVLLYPEATVYLGRFSQTSIRIPTIGAPDSSLARFSSIATPRVTHVWVAGTSIEPKIGIGVSGLTSLKGIPFMPGEAMWVAFYWPPDALSGGAWCGTAATGGRGALPTDWAGRMPERHTDIFVDVHGPGASPRGGSVDLEAALGLQLAGLVGTRPFAEERGTGEIEVRVIDHYGLPVPFAAVGLLTSDYSRLSDVDEAGTWRLDPYTNADGRRTFTRAPAGRLSVGARVGTREGRADVEVVEGGRHTVTITVRRPVAR